MPQKLAQFFGIIDQFLILTLVASALEDRFGFGEENAERVALNNERWELPARSSNYPAIRILRVRFDFHALHILNPILRDDFLRTKGCRYGRVCAMRELLS
jgi:hypothetical protein